MHSILLLHVGQVCGADLELCNENVDHIIALRTYLTAIPTIIWALVRYTESHPTLPSRNDVAFRSNRIAAAAVDVARAAVLTAAAHHVATKQSTRMRTPPRRTRRCRKRNTCRYSTASGAIHVIRANAIRGVIASAGRASRCTGCRKCRHSHSCCPMRIIQLLHAEPVCGEDLELSNENVEL
jgi:hypothetical protein